MNNRLKKKSLASIFSSKEQSTLSYLIDLGFSNQIITDFFNPFFTGIFLEPHLETSSRMFEFVYKMFGEGHASLPKSGIEAIPKQLFKNLNNTNFKFNTKVVSIENNEITLDNKTKLKTSFTIDATNLLSNSRNPSTDWKSCHVLYFETDDKIIQKKLIGLIPKKEALINNIFYHTSLKTDNRAKKELLSVTVVHDKNLEKSKIIERVKLELKEYCGIEAGKFIKHYYIPQALPDVKNLQCSVKPTQTGLPDNTFLAGDSQLNGSLNAAIVSGEEAAMRVIEKLSN